MDLVIEEALKLLRSTLPETVDLEQLVEPRCPAIRANSVQMHRLVINLAVSAWHRLVDQRGLIQVRLEHGPLQESAAYSAPALAAQPHVRLVVRDNGRRESGMGSMAEAEAAVRENAGVLISRDEPDGARTLTAFLPAHVPAAVTVNVPTAAPAGTSGERILYVDDDQLVGQALTELLNLLGFKTIHVMQPREALALFATRPTDFDLLITDRAMPGMTGGELAAEILKIRPDLPVLLVTGYADPSMEKELLEIGVRQVLNKPLSAHKLAEAVRRLLANPVSRS